MHNTNLIASASAKSSGGSRGRVTGLLMRRCVVLYSFVLAIANTLLST
jgi:hypothetical protein